MKNSAIRKTERRAMLLAVCFFVITYACYAQDIIVTKDSRRIEAKVTEVNVDNVRYQLFDNQDGPAYTILKSDIVTILYQNGRVEMFSTETQPPTQAAPVATQPPVQATPTATQAPTQPVRATSQTSGLALSKEEVVQRMALNAPPLYDMYSSAHKLSRVGMGMTLGGFGLAMIGFAVAEKEEIVNTGTYVEYRLSGPGAGLYAVGIISTVVGTPLWIIGGVKKKNTRNAYIRQYGYSYHVPVNPSPYLQLSAAPNTVGLKLTF